MLVRTSRLELVRVGGEHLEVADAVVARAGLEDILEGQAREGGVAARAAAADGHPLSVDQALASQEQRGVAAVVNVHHAPRGHWLRQPLPVLLAKAGAASVVDIRHRNASRGPVLCWQQ